MELQNFEHDMTANDHEYRTYTHCYGVIREFLGRYSYIKLLGHLQKLIQMLARWALTKEPLSFRANEWAEICLESQIKIIQLKFSHVFKISLSCDGEKFASRQF